MTGLFEGLRVVEVASFVFAPGAGAVLSDFGAEVIHVEPPGIGDPLRVLYKIKPFPESEDNYCWMIDGRNKKSIVIDLKQAQGHDILVDLVRTADVLITNYQPSVLEELNITYEQMRACNPRLIYAHATGYGEAGDEVEKPGYDATAWWARSGMMDAVRPKDGELSLSAPAMGDHPSSITLLAGIVMGLYARERSGKGTKISSSLMANGAWANSILVQAALCGAPPLERSSQSTTRNAVLNHYTCADGRSFCLLLMKEAEEFERFCEAIGQGALAADARFAEVPARREHSRELAAILGEVFGAQPMAYWRQVLDQHGITFGIIATSQDAASDRQMEDNGVFAEFVDAPGKRVVSSPINIADFPKTAPRMPPELGQHSEEILASLGYDAEKRDTLFAAGVVAAPD